jgi:hypothetical protein
MISHSMGQQRVQLGMNVVATAMPADGDPNVQPEDVVLYFGIIDILQVRGHGPALTLCVGSSREACILFDYVRDDLSLVGMRYDWWRKCQNRNGWKTTN